MWDSKLRVIIIGRGSRTTESRRERPSSYDRAGLAWSDPGPADETVEQTIRDLHAREAESERNLFRRVRYSCSGPPLLFPFCCPAPQGLQLGNGASIGGRDFPRVRKVEAA